MHIDRKTLSSLAWYRLVKVLYFVALSLLLVFAVLIGIGEPKAGFIALAVVALVAEIARQMFFYVVTGKFISDKYKKNLFQISIRIGTLLVVILLVILAAKIIEKVQAELCESRLGEEGFYYEGVCECRYGYTLQDDICVSNDAVCQETLGENAISIGGQCECQSGYALMDGVCTKTDDVCAQQFGNAEGVSGLDDKCRCKVGYQWNDARDYCIKIEPPKLSEKEKCEQQGYKANFNLMNNQCECTFNYVKINGTCQDAPYCGENAHYDEKLKCVCDEDYKNVENKCIKPDCPALSNYDSETDGCLCIPGYTVRNGQCTFLLY